MNESVFVILRAEEDYDGSSKIQKAKILLTRGKIQTDSTQCAGAQTITDQD